jgi:hypothetical protein
MCFSAAWLLNVVLFIIIVAGCVALFRLFVAFAAPKLGIGGEVLNFIVSALTILFWVVVLCALAIGIFDLISCLLGGSIGLPRMR